MTELSRGDYILRALIASEIAESTQEPHLRRSFQDLTTNWLSNAEAARARPSSQASAEAD